jgi:hypothetical protein
MCRRSLAGNYTRGMGLVEERGVGRRLAARIIKSVMFSRRRRMLKRWRREHGRDSVSHGPHNRLRKRRRILGWFSRSLEGATGRTLSSALGEIS